MSSIEFHIGMDDVDDPGGKCTTHFASLVVELLSRHSVEWLDYPNLVRLNPGIPFRTRGNGAVALRFKAKPATVSDVLPLIEHMIHDYIDEAYPNTNPGLVIVDTEIPEDIRKFSKQALWRTIPIELARRLIKRHDLTYISHGNGRGLVGALSAIGNTLQDDYTFEYLAYRGMDQSRLDRDHAGRVVQLEYHPRLYQG